MNIDLMHSRSYRLWLLLLVVALLSACSRNKPVVCDDAAKGRARQFMTQVLEQEANGLRLSELVAKGGRRVFYANVAYDAADELRSDMIYVRKDFKVGEASCASELMDDKGRVIAQRIEVRVEFPEGLWFDRRTYGAAPASEHIYALRLDDKFKVTGRLPAPFISGRTAITLLGTEPYTAESLLELRKQLVDGPPQQ
jgi:hypothetical protein